MDNELGRIADLSSARLGDRVLLVLHLNVDRPEPGGYQYETGLLVCDLSSGTPDLVAFLRVPTENCWTSQLQDLGSGSFRLLCGARAEGKGRRPMVFWSTPWSSSTDFSLTVAGSAIDDSAARAAVTWLSRDTALAATDNTLWAVDIESGTARILDQDDGQPMFSLNVVDW